MKVSLRKVKKAALKRKRAQEGPREERLGAAPKRQMTQAPPDHREPVTDPIDLTADTSQEEVTPGAATEPCALVEAVSPAGVRDWGEGPSGEAGAPPEVAPAASPEHEAPEPAGATESRVGAAPRRPSLMDDGRRAERLLAPAVLPEFQEEIRQLGASSFFREIASVLLQSVNFFAAAREIIYDEEAMIRDARREAEDATRRAEAESRRLNVALSQLARAEDAASAKELHVAELTSALQAAEGRARDAEERLKAADSRVAELEAEAQEADAATEAKIKQSEVAAEGRIAEAVARAAEAESRAAEAGAKAVADFRASEGFEDELAEASAEAFLQGFRHGKEKVARDCNLPQALEVEPSESSEEGDSAAGP